MNYKDGLKHALKTILYWLKSEDTLFFRSKKQKALDRKYWHEAAEIMGLKHFTIEYTQYRYFCIEHKKYCSRWQSSAGKYSSGQCYDSDHECSGDDKYQYSEDDHCLPELRIMERRNVYILATELTNITNSGKMLAYLRLEGYDAKPPFCYPYVS